MNVLIAEGTPWLAQFDRWTNGWNGQDVHLLPREQVHKRDSGNVFIARMEPIGPQHDHAFAVQFRVPQTHPYFYEHPLDHVPGLALIEAGRQVGIAAAHRYYGVALEGFVFLIHSLAIEFTAFAEHDAPVFGRCRFSEVQMRKDRLSGMVCEGLFMQHGRTIGSMHGHWQVVPSPVFKRMRRGGGSR
jgi:hypothetical protein